MPRPICVYNRCFGSQSLREYHIIDVIDKFAMGAKCLCSELRKSKSGYFCGSSFAVQRLLECKDDVTGHIQSCHLSKRCGQSAFKLFLGQQFPLVQVREFHSTIIKCHHRLKYK